MATQLYKINDKDIKRLIKFDKKAPGKMKIATAGMLNSFAFGNRKESLNIINRRMTVRSKKFVQSSIRVDKARGNQSIDKQRSSIGSINRPRFTGWEEQETGKRSKRNRVATTLARGGDFKRKIKPSARLKSANTFRSPDDYKGGSPHNRAVIMLQDLHRKKWRKPFIIKGHKRIKRGLYKILRKKLQLLQSFNPRNTQPKRVRWLSGGTKMYFRKTDIRMLWADQLARVLKFKKR